MNLTTLPTDILILVLHRVSVADLAVLARTCRSMNAHIMAFGWTGYLRANPRPSHSLLQSRAHWSPQTQVRYDVMADRSWSQSQFVARPLARPWLGKTQPILVNNPSRLVVAAGSDIHVHGYGSTSNEESPPLLFEGKFSFPKHEVKLKDITAITFADDAGPDRTLFVGLQDGALRRVVLPDRLSSSDDSTPGMSYSSIHQLPGGDFLESLTSQKNVLLSLSSMGNATLASVESPTNSPPSVQLNSRSWTSYLSLNSSSPFAAFGISSVHPLRVHSITNDQMTPTASAILHTNTSGDRPFSSAVYGISQAPPGSPWGASPSILVSGWFDGQVRCHDLRSSSRLQADNLQGSLPAPLRPVLSLQDPLQLESIYCVSCGGGSASYIAAGSARHSLVSFWDVRSPRSGWSVHAPGNDRSPVYSVILESSRLYGATQSRPFVYDFGPWVSSNTYPSLPSGRGIDGLKRKKGSNDIGYYVTKYPHIPRHSSVHET